MCREKRTRSKKRRSVSSIVMPAFCGLLAMLSIVLAAVGCFMSEGDIYASSLTSSILSESADFSNQTERLPLADTGNTKTHAVVPGASEIPLVNAASNERTIFCYRGMNLVFAGSDTPYSRQRYFEKLQELPEAISKTLSERGWKIIITHRFISDMFPIESMPSDVSAPTGICWIPEKKIYINDQSLPSVITHELAHAIDWESGGASLRKDWTEALCEDTINAKGKQNILFTKQASGDITNKIYSREWFFEYWAEAFETYWNNPEALVQQYPRCYDYFEKRFGAALDEEKKQEAVQAGRQLDIDDIMMDETGESTAEERIQKRNAADTMLRITRVLSASAR